MTDSDIHVVDVRAHNVCAVQVPGYNQPVHFRAQMYKQNDVVLFIVTPCNILRHGKGQNNSQTDRHTHSAPDVKIVNSATEMPPAATGTVRDQHRAACNGAAAHHVMDVARVLGNVVRALHKHKERLRGDSGSAKDWQAHQNGGRTHLEQMTRRGCPPTGTAAHRIHLRRAR